MTDSSDIFSRAVELYRGTIYKEVTTYPGFTHLKSTFNDAWYNFLVPTVSEKDFPWGKATEIIQSEAKNGVSMSYYVQSSLLKEYQPVFDKKGQKLIGNDVYMVARIKEPFLEIKDQYVDLTSENVDLFVEMAKTCFPDWENNEEYGRYFLELNKKMTEPIFENFLSQANGINVGFGNVVISPKLGLSYLHNTGILEAYRRQGHYADLVKYRCNKSLERGVKEVFAIVEEGGGSYHGLLKLGFHPQTTYYLFS